MYCYKCGVKNHTMAKFCYNCGTKIIKGSQNKNVYEKSLYKNRRLNFFGGITREIPFCGNKYFDIFMCLSAMVLSSSFFVHLCVGLPKSIGIASELALSCKDMYYSILVKEQLEQSFRDIWCQLFLILFLFTAFVFSLIFLVTVANSGKKRHRLRAYK